MYNLGLFFIFLYCVIYATAQIFTGHFEQSISPYLLATYIFLITLIFYFFVTCLRLKDTLNLISLNRGLVLKINISTALSWLTIIYALKYIAPAEAFSIAYGLLPISAMITSFFNKEVLKPTSMDFLFAIVLSLLVLILCVDLIHKYLILDSAHIHLIIFAILLCVISSVPGAYNNIYAKMLSQQHFRPSQILAIRFYFAFIAAALLLLLMQGPLIPKSNQWLPITLITFSSTIIPIYLLQIGINFSNAIAVALITPITPALTFFLQLFDPRIKFSPSMFILSSLVSIIILVATIYKINKNNSRRNS